MKIHYVREFLLLASNKNFSKTADQLYMSQSTLSRHISSMEKELGVQLIDRSSYTFKLTPAGSIAVKGFQKVLNEYHNTLSELGTLSSKASGELRLGILYYDINHYIADIRNTIRQHYPDVKLTLISHQPEQAEQALFDDNVDAILTYNAMPTFGDGISVHNFLKTPYYVLCSPNHRFMHNETVYVSDLNGEVLLNPPNPFQICVTKHVVTSMFTENHVQPKKVIPVTNFDEVPTLLEENKAVFISPMVNPEIYSQSVVYRLLEPDRYQARISAVWKTENHNPLIQLLVNAIKITYS
ncbi:MAG: LysR family transcriptional regulator [Saccharofermentanales bacterium]|jgi:DNA-binding transcriptional LysR family regulator